MTNKEIKFLVDELLLKAKFLSDALSENAEQRSLGGTFGTVDTSQVLFEVEEGVAFLISGGNDDNED